MNIDKIKNQMKNIPFGNSQFQIKNFISNQETPERTYRNVLLQLNQKLNSMQECVFRRKRRELDIEEAQEKIKTAQGIEAKRLQVDIEEAQYYLDNEIKLIEDCAIEIATYESILNTLPEYSREEFEKSEYLFWKSKLLIEAEQDIKSSGLVSKGIIQSLNQIGIKCGRSEDGIFKYIEYNREIDAKQEK